jgi:hypothetical protein
MSTEAAALLAPPEPIPDDDTSHPEVALRAHFTAQAVDALRKLVEGLEAGWHPVRALHLIETVAKTHRVQLAEVCAADLDDEGGLLIRKCTADDMELGDDGGFIRMGGAGLIHGGARPRRARYPRRGEEKDRQMMAMAQGLFDNLGDVFDKQNDGKDEAKIKNLAAALQSARAVEDADLERQIRERLDQLLDTDTDTDTAPAAA